MSLEPSVKTRVVCERFMGGLWAKSSCKTVMGFGGAWAVGIESITDGAGNGRLWVRLNNQCVLPLRVPQPTPS
jgi:hypothetical protein